MTDTPMPLPYALVLRGGNQVGKRLSTRLAYLMAPVRDEAGAVIGYKARLSNSARGRWTVYSYLVEIRDIVDRWQLPPNRSQLGKAKAKLSVYNPQGMP